MRYWYIIAEFLAGIKAKILTVTGTAGGGYIDVAQQGSTPGNPATGFSRVYAKADGNLYRKDPSGVESVVGSGAGGGGATNYLAKWTDCSAPIDTLESGLAFTVGVSVRANPTLWGHSADTNLVPLKVTTGNLSGGSSYQLTPMGDATGSVQTPLFQLEKIDQGGKPLTLSLAISNVHAAGDYDVVLDRYNSSYVYQGSIPFVGNMSTGSPVSATLPVGTTRFTSFAIASGAATDYFAIRYRRLNAAVAASVAVLIDEMSFGAQQANTASGIGPWKMYTPAPSGFGTTSNVEFWYRENGDSLDLSGKFTSGTPAASEARLPLPSGYTVKNSTINIVGKGLRGTAVGSNLKQYAILAAAGVSYLKVGIDDTVTALNPISPQNGDQLISAGQGFYFFANAVPVAELSANNNVLSNPNISFDMAGAISMWAGPTAPKGSDFCDGGELSKAAYPDLYANIGDTWKNCTNPLTGVAWGNPAAGNFRKPDLRSAFTRGVGGPNAAGITTTLAGYQGDTFQSHYHDTPGDYRFVAPGSSMGGAGALNATAYSDIGEPIANPSYSPLKTGAETRPQNVGVNYIIRLFNSGLAAGVCPISSRNIVGDTSGTTVPMGLPGEQVFGSAISDNIVLTTAFGTISTITLSPGVWMLWYEVMAAYVTAASTSSSGLTSVRIADAGGTNLLGSSQKGVQPTAPTTNISSAGESSLRATEIVSISSTTNYTCQARKFDFTNTGVGKIYSNTTDGQSVFRAVRIA